MPLELQAKLLRAVQEKRIQPVGSEEIPVDVWVIAATNQDLLQLIDEGRFRRDLYFRLAGFVLGVPPLRDRADDLEPLIEHFLRQATVAENQKVRGLSVKVMEIFRRYSWPGNVRELKHEVKRLAHLVVDGQLIDSTLLSDRLLKPRLERCGEAPEASAEPASWLLRDHVQELERRMIEKALVEVGGSQRKAAGLLGISRNTLARKIAAMGTPIALRRGPRGEGYRAPTVPAARSARSSKPASRLI